MTDVKLQFTRRTVLSAAVATALAPKSIQGKGVTPDGRYRAVSWWLTPEDLFWPSQELIERSGGGRTGAPRAALTAA